MSQPYIGGNKGFVNFNGDKTFKMRLKIMG